MPETLIRKIFSVVFRFTITLLCLGILAIALTKGMPQFAAKPSLDNSANEQSSSQNLNDISPISNRLIMESIVAIIQSYYVDEKRVRNDFLIKGMLQQLVKKYPGMSFETHGSTLVVSDEGLEIASLGLLTIDQGELLDSLVGIARHIQAKNRTASETKIVIDNLQLSNAYAQVLDALLRGLDAHSMFLSSEDYEELRQGTEGQFGGLGILVGIRNNLLTVIKPLPNSPALQAGLKREDRIIQINGFDTFGYSLDELIEHMRGEPGSDVKLSILRKNFALPIELDLKRENINVSSVQSKILDNHGYKTGYVSIESFSSRTSADLKKELNAIRSKAGTKFNGLILDLRANPGGLLDQAVAVADIFIEDGVIVSTRGRHEDIEYAQRAIKKDTNYPIVVLIDGETASASEIVSGALQDHNRAVIVGQPTFGKGTVQTIFELPGGQALKMTVARYFTPKDKSIQTVGIVPDVWLQPIYKSDENADLMGSFHYRSERFLSNHIAHQAGYNQSLNEFSMRSPFKGYYLRKFEQYPEFKSEDDSEDVELNMAKEIIADVTKIYGNRLGKDANRANHWLGLSSQKILTQMNAMEAEMNQWLSSQFGIDWSVKGESNSSQVVFQPSIYNVNSVKGGESLKIPYKIKNLSQIAKDRVSVFVWSQEAGIYTEKLIGSMPPRSDYDGLISVAIPYGLQSDRIGLNIALSFDGVPDTTTNHFQSLSVRSRHLPKFLVEASYKETVGNHDGVVNENESGEINLFVENLDVREFQDLTLRVVGLCGDQLNVTSDSEIKIDKFISKMKRNLKYKVRAGKRLFSGACNMGVEILADNHRKIFSKGFSVPMHGQHGLSKNTNLIGH